MTCRDATWIFLVGAIGAAALLAVWSMPPIETKFPVRLTKEGEEGTQGGAQGGAQGETKQEDNAEAKTDAQAKAETPNAAEGAEAKAPEVLYRRYHHWNSPHGGGQPTTSLEGCETACSGDPTCFGVTYDPMVKTCGMLPKGNFDVKSGLLGEFTADDVVTSMKDRSLKTDNLDCFGPYKRGEVPGHIPPTYCPRSREAAVNAYFHNSRPMHLFAGMFPGGHQTNMYGSF